MTNLAKLEYAALDITGKNYLTWVLDTKIHLEVGNLGDTIREESSSSSQNQAKAMIFIRRHLDEALKSEYLTVKILAEYNSALFRITSQMKLCGDTITDEMLLEKTYITFHANNVLLQQKSAPFPEVNAASLEVNATSSGGQFDATHLDVSDFIMERGNEVYRSD
nr:uncharacterized protein LOC114820877 [Malus domestica]